MLDEATLTCPPTRCVDASAAASSGVHTEHSSQLLAEMQVAAARVSGRAMVMTSRPPMRRHVEPALAAIWAMLGGIPDPEIPVISIVELGIVRDVARDGRRHAS